jgi:serine/threonine protein kinase
VPCACGSALPIEHAGIVLCPACLLRLTLAPGFSTTIDHEPAARLVGPVGRGPHGIVHLAVRPDDDPQLVTVKVIEVATDPQRFCERMRQTGIALESLRHPGIPELVQIGVTGSDQPFVVASYVAGAPLRDYLRRRRGEVSDRVHIAAHLSSLIADLHRHGIVHGSLKPTNIIVSESDEGPFPFVLDTGIVAAIEGGAGGTRLATQGRDERQLHALLAEVLSDRGGVSVGTESAAELAEMFARRAGDARCNAW